MLWFVPIIFGAVFSGIGIAFLFFTDALCEWQIRLLQSRWYRLQMRVMGLFFAIIGIVAAWALETGKLH